MTLDHASRRYDDIKVSLPKRQLLRPHEAETGVSVELLTIDLFRFGDLQHLRRAINTHNVGVTIFSKLHSNHAGSTPKINNFGIFWKLVLCDIFSNHDGIIETSKLLDLVILLGILIVQLPILVLVLAKIVT